MSPTLLNLLRKISGRNRQYLILPLLLFIYCSVNSQSRISGIIVDREQAPVQQANVLLMKTPDTALFKGMISAADGSFQFENIPSGDYIIAISFSGFEQTFSKPIIISADKKEIDLGLVRLPQLVSELTTVTVSAKKPLFQQLIDRTVVNVEGSITAAGSTALDVLARSPGVMIDYQNNAITMNGKSGVVVMINGKQSYMPMAAVVQMLQGMSANNIEKIELITTPPANFNAEGNAGYINIVLKSNNNVGTNGSFSVMGGYGRGLISSGNLNFNHRKGKMNIYGDGSYSRTYSYQNIRANRTVNYQNNLIKTQSSSDRDIVLPNFNARLGVDYQLDNKTILGLLLIASENIYSMEALNVSEVSTNNIKDSSIKTDNFEDNKWSNYGANINLQRTLKKDASITLNLDYIKYKNSDPVDYLNNYYNTDNSFRYQTHTRSGKITPITFYVGSLDYTKKFSSKVSMDAGVKSTISTFSNDISFDELKNNNWIRDPSLSALYKLDENYSAAYTSFSLVLGKKTEAKVGTRYEYTNSNLGTETQSDIVDRHYGNFFPSIFISHKPDANNSFNFSYSRRITRPTFNDLAPFTYYVDPNSLISGNSALQPAFSNILKGEYTYKSYYFSLSYTKEDGSIQGFQPKVDSVRNKQVLSAENIKNRKTLSAVVAIPITVNNWWSMQYNLMANWQEANIDYRKAPVRIRQTNWSFNGNQRFTLPKNWSAELSGFFMSADLGGVFVQKSMGSLDVGIKKKLRDNKSSLQFAASNILNSMRIDFVANVPQENINTDVQLDFFYRSFKLTYTRSFGKEKLREKRNRTTASEAERERVK